MRSACVGVFGSLRFMFRCYCSPGCVQFRLKGYIASWHYTQSSEFICIPNPSIANTTFCEHKELESINIYSLKVKIALNHSSVFGEHQI